MDAKNTPQGVIIASEFTVIAVCISELSMHACMKPQAVREQLRV